MTKTKEEQKEDALKSSLAFVELAEKYRRDAKSEMSFTKDMIRNLNMFGELNSSSFFNRRKREVLLNLKCDNISIDKDLLFAAWLMQIAPVAAMFAIQNFGGERIYMHNSKMIAALSPSDQLPVNRKRRKAAVQGKRIPSLAENPLLKDFVDARHNVLINEKSSMWFKMSKTQQRLLVRLAVLKTSMNSIIYHIERGNELEKRRALQNLTHFVRNYPDVLSLQYGSEGKTVANYIFSLDKNTMFDIVSAAVKKEINDKTTDGQLKVEIKGYKVSPEEFIAYAIKENPQVIKVLSERFASLFAMKNRRDEQVANMIQLAVNNPAHMEDIMLPFMTTTKYDTAENISFKLLREAKGVSAEVYQKALKLHLDIMPQERRVFLLNSMREAVRRTMDDKTQDAINMRRLSLLDKYREI